MVKRFKPLAPLTIYVESSNSFGKERKLYRPLFVKRALRWAGGPFLQNFFLQIFNHKGHTHISTKIGEKNPVISGIGPFDNQKFGVNAL